MLSEQFAFLGGSIEHKSGFNGLCPDMLASAAAFYSTILLQSAFLLASKISISSEDVWRFSVAG